MSKLTIMDGSVRWRIVLILSAVVVKLYPLRDGVGNLPVSRDSLIFEHSGWRIVNGARLYIDYAEVKPPVIHELSAVMAVIAHGNMLYLHLINVAMANVFIIGAVVLIGLLIYNDTEDEVAAVLGGLSLFALPSVITLGWRGAAAKPGTVATGLSASISSAHITISYLVLPQHSLPASHNSG